MNTNNNDFGNGKNYDQVWTDRFNFFQQNGAPNTKTFKAALKLLPTGKKMRINANFYALFFNVIYFLIKGMWKGAITVFVILAVCATLVNLIPGFIGSVISFIGILIPAFTANYTYYRKEILGEDDFNIFKGMRL